MVQLKFLDLKLLSLLQIGLQLEWLIKKLFKVKTTFLITIN
jgi:hypothetical protein